MLQGCAAFLWIVLFAFLGLLAFILIATNPWILILAVIAVAMAIPIFIIYSLGRLTLRYPLIALSILGIIILIAFLQRE